MCFLVEYRWDRGRILGKGRRGYGGRGFILKFLLGGSCWEILKV